MTAKKKLLHVGCGAPNPEKIPPLFRGKEWEEVRLDIDPNVKPDIVASMTDMSAVEEGSMDGLFSSHNLEHLYLYQIPGALKEFFRVLKPGGVLILTLPDLQSICAYIAEGIIEDGLYESPAGKIMPVDVVYGWSSALAAGNHYMAHKSGVSANTLAKHLFSAGFSNITIRREWIDLWATALKLPEGHKERVARAQIRTTRMAGPGGQQYPFWYQRRILMQENPEVKTDELDTPPSRWKKVGIAG